MAKTALLIIGGVFAISGLTGFVYSGVRRSAVGLFINGVVLAAGVVMLKSQGVFF